MLVHPYGNIADLLVNLTDDHGRRGEAEHLLIFAQQLRNALDIFSDSVGGLRHDFHMIVAEMDDTVAQFSEGA